MSEKHIYLFYFYDDSISIIIKYTNKFVTYFSRLLNYIDTCLYCAWQRRKKTTERATAPRAFSKRSARGGPVARDVRSHSGQRAGTNTTE